MLEETQLSNAPFLPLLGPEAVDLGPELGKLLFLLLAGDLGNFWQVDELPVANNLLLNILVLLAGVLLLVLLGFLDALLLFKHMLKY